MSLIKLPANVIRKLFTLFLFATVAFTISLTPVKADLTVYQNTCSTLSATEGCQPPQLSDAQQLVTELIVLAWSLGALLFFVLLLYNGAIYLLGSWEDSKYILGASIEDVQKRMAQWGTGFFIFFLSYPLMNTMLQALVADTDCYATLRQPGFTFFFPTLCQQITFNTPPVLKAVPKEKVASIPCSSFLASKNDTTTNLEFYCTQHCSLQFVELTYFPMPSPYNGYAVCDCSANIVSGNKCWGVATTLPKL